MPASPDSGEAARTKRVRPLLHASSSTPPETTAVMLLPGQFIPPARSRIRHRHFHTLVLGRSLSALCPVYRLFIRQPETPARPALPLLSGAATRGEGKVHAKRTFSSRVFDETAAVLTGQGRDPKTATLQKSHSLETSLFNFGNISLPQLFISDKCALRVPDIQSVSLLVREKLHVSHPPRPAPTLPLRCRSSSK